MKDRIAADERIEEKNFLRRFEDKPPYLCLASESHVVVGRAVPSAPGKRGKWTDAFLDKLYAPQSVKGSERKESPRVFPLFSDKL